MANEKDFVQLIKQHQKIIHKVCHVYMDTAFDREDLFQEITLQAWKTFGNFRGDAQFSTWLYRVALNTAITYLKKEKKYTQATATMVQKETEDVDDFEDRSQAMHKAIAQLSKIDKALVTLYLEDYSYIAIGEILGISANNVAVKINRLKWKLKEETQKNYQF